MTDFSDRTVVVTGATGAAGTAVVRHLRAAGAHVVAAGRDQARLDELAAGTEPAPSGEGAGPIRTAVVDLGDEQSTRTWAGQVRDRGAVDGVIHLVGGWRGGTRFADTSLADAAWLHDQVVRTTQHVSLAFHDDLVASSAGRFAIVSATAVTSPSRRAAAYASAKAAAETWTMAMADSFAHAPGDDRRAAATIFVVQYFVSPAMRAAEPDNPFTGATDVDDLARAVVDLWSRDAAELNGARIELAA